MSVTSRPEVRAVGALLLQDELLCCLRTYYQADDVFACALDTGLLNPAAYSKVKRARSHVRQMLHCELSHLAMVWPFRHQPHAACAPDGTWRLLVSSGTE